MRPNTAESLERSSESAYAELERRETLMRQAEELAHLGSFDFDLRTQTLKWSDELFHIFGRDAKTFEPTFMRFLEAVHPEDREALHSKIERAARTLEPFGFEERIVRPDGSIRVLQTLARVFVDASGRPVRLAGCCQDVTERKQFEAVRSRLIQLIEYSDDAIIGLSPEGVIESWNPAAARVFGYQAQEAIGQPCGMLVPPGAHQRWREFLAAAGSGQHVARYELKHCRRDGSVFTASVTLSAVLDTSGTVVGMSKVLRDITSEKTFENQLRSSLREKEVLLREIHHRVKNNLQVIASLLSIQLSVEHDEVAHKGLVESQNRIQSMALVHQLLYRSKDLAQIDLGEYLTNLTYRLVETYDVARDRIHVIVPETPLRLDIDRAIPCGLIVNELVTNALTHAFPDRRRGEINITIEVGPETIALVVADNGVGLPRTDKRVHSFGLRIARTLTLQLGGSLTLKSEGGTVARVEFPRHA